MFPLTGTILSLCLLSVAAGCPGGFQEIGGSCFVMGSGKKTFKKATASCQQIGGFLVEPRSEEITDAVKTFTFTGLFWIGLNDVGKNRIFTWQTDRETLSYTNWASKQPDNYKGKQHCVAVTKSGTWDDRYCDYKRPYICQAHTSKRSAIGFTSSTSSIIPLITSTLTLRCESRVSRVKNNYININYITSIVISQDGVDVATLTEHFPATSLVNSPDVHVTGSLPGQGGGKGYLEVTFDHPTDKQTGLFKCEVDSFDSKGQSYDFSKTLEVMEEEITLKDLVHLVKNLTRDKELLEKTVGEMKQTNAQILQDNFQMNTTITDQAREILGLQQKMTQDKAQINATITGISQTNTDQDREILGLQQKMTQDKAQMNATITGIRQTNTDQAREILGLQQTCDKMDCQVDKSLTQVFFSAGLSSARDTGTVIYDEVFSNVGSAYNPATGVFTSTVAGYYRFVTSLLSRPDLNACLALKHNNNQVYLVYSQSGKGYQSATNSAIIKLNKGDTVRVEYTFSFSFVWAHPGQRQTSFNGQLISAV